MEEIFIPATGMAMEDAELVAWLKQPGDAVAAGDPIATIETDKVTVDIEAETAGVLGAHLVEAGTVVGAGVVITRVLHDGDAPEAAAPAAAAAGPEPAPPAPAPAQPAPAAPAAAANPVPPPQAAPVPPPAAPAPASQPAPAASEPPVAVPRSQGVDAATGSRRPHTLTPRQRRELRERNAAAAAPASGALVSSPETAGAPAELDGPRKADAVAKAVSESWSTIPHFAVSREIDVTGMLLYLDQVRASGTRASVTDLLLRAASRAWNTVRPGGPDRVGLSVATPRRVINVAVPGVAQLSLPELTERRASAVDRARRGLLKPDDLQASPLTLSNLGTHGVDWFTGIVPVGQTALLTVGRARETVQIVDGRFAARTMMWATVNLDHREFDGADGAVLLEAFARACSITLNDPLAQR